MGSAPQMLGVKKKKKKDQGDGQVDMLPDMIVPQAKLFVGDKRQTPKCWVALEHLNLLNTCI